MEDESKSEVFVGGFRNMVAWKSLRNESKEKG